MPPIECVTGRTAGYRRCRENSRCSCVREERVKHALEHKMPSLAPRGTLDLLRAEANIIDGLLRDIQVQAQSRQMYDAILQLRDRIKADLRLIESGEVPPHLLEAYFSRGRDRRS